MLQSSHFLSYYHHDALAKAATSTLIDVTQSSLEQTKTALQTTQLLMQKYAHSQVVHNSLRYMLYQLPKENLTTALQLRQQEILKSLNDKTMQIANIIEKKIPQNSTLFVHGLTHHLIKGLELAQSKKQFTVHVLEHQPLALGKHFRDHLDHVHLFPDTAIYQALHDVDICLIGCEGYSSKEIMCKIGATTILSLCKTMNITPYFVTHALHYSAGNLMHNTYDTHHDFDHVHEFLSPEQTRFITEFGIITHSHLIDDTKRHHTWTK